MISLYIKMTTTVLCGLLAVAGVTAQVKINEPTSVSEALYRYGTRFDEDLPYNGWSILLMVDTDRRAVDRFQSEFKALHPEYRDYMEWRYEQPYYKVILGAFADQTSANVMITRLKSKYRGLIAVRNTFPRKEIMRFRRVSGS